MTHHAHSKMHAPYMKKPGVGHLKAGDFFKDGRENKPRLAIPMLGPPFLFCFRSGGGGGGGHPVSFPGHRQRF